ncbi:MAG TPA: zf-HC2 domain-containing protein [Steroidobacteraceae bacterium]
MKLSNQMMPDQPHDLDLLAAFAEGRLDEPDRQRVITHVAECVECRRTLAHLGRAIADGSLPRAAKRPAAPGIQWSNARVWLPIAASVLVGTFAWFQLATSPDVSTEGESPAAGVSEEELLTKRSGGRIVAGKTFRMTSGEWVDAAFDPSLGVPTVVIRGADERSALLARIPELTPFTELGDRVVVVWDGTVYRFEP